MLFEGGEKVVSLTVGLLVDLMSQLQISDTKSEWSRVVRGGTNPDFTLTVCENGHNTMPKSGMVMCCVVVRVQLPKADMVTMTWRGGVASLNLKTDILTTPEQIQITKWGSGVGEF